MAENPAHKLFKPNATYSIYEFLSLVIPYYYSNNKIFGSKGDFITAPEISQVFGELIGVYIAYNWQEMGSPKNVNLIEFGAGRGTLMNDFLRATKHVKDFHASINIHIIETSQLLKTEQKQALSNFNVTWHEDLSSIPKDTNFYIGNEFFDALPIKQYIYQDNKLYEIAIKFDENYKPSRSLIELNNILQDKILQSHPNLKTGSVVEINQVAISILQDVIENVKNHKGGALFIDYGYLESNYKDTLQAVKNHKYHYIFDDIGKADITSLVDFSSLINALKQHNIDQFYCNTQREFLLSLGIDHRKEILLGGISDIYERKTIESSINRLIDNDKMGGLFKVLSFFRG